MHKFDRIKLVFVLCLVIIVGSGAPLYAYVALLLGFLALVTAGCIRIQYNFFIPAFNQNKSYPGKAVCLTFDDGPDPVNTPVILEILEEFNVKATFFLIGSKVDRSPELVRSIVEKGHLVGNHSYSHQNHFPVFSARKIAEEILHTSARIEMATGKFPLCFRPPFGVTNPNIAKAIRNTGFHTIGWNIRSFDTLKRDVAKTTQRIIRLCKPGSLILLHDNVPETAGVLREIIVFLKQHEYEVILPDKLFGITWYRSGENA